MASVQELLLAANSKAPKSVFSSLNDLLDTGTQAYQTGQNIRDKNVEIATRLVQLDQMRQEQEFQKQRRAQLAQQLGMESDQSTKTALNDAAVKPIVAMPAIKLKSTSIDEKGHISDSYAPAQKEAPNLQMKEYYDSASGKNKLGVFDPEKGTITQTPSDALAPVNGSASDTVPQPKLYHQSVSNMRQFFSSRSGNFGTQDAKVNQALHLANLADQYYNPATDTHDIPEAQSSELLMGLANLVSGSNVSTVEGLRSITPKNTQSDMAHIVAYWTGKPVTSQPEAMTKNILDSIDRQGTVAEDLRNTYLQQGKDAFVEPGLDENNTKRLLGLRVGSSFKDYIQTRKASRLTKDSPSDTSAASSVPVPKVGAVEDGQIFKGGNPADPNNWEKVK